MEQLHFKYTVCAFPLFPFIIDVHSAWHLLFNYILSAVINTTQVSQHDSLMTLSFPFISFEHALYFPTTVTPSTHDSLPSLCFLFSLLASTSRHGLFHDALRGYSGLLLATLAVTHLYLTTKGESLPNLDCLSPLIPPKTPLNEPVRLAPVPAWRKVKSGTAPTLSP